MKIIFLLLAAVFPFVFCVIGDTENSDWDMMHGKQWIEMVNTVDPTKINRHCMIMTPNGYTKKGQKILTFRMINPENPQQQKTSEQVVVEMEGGTRLSQRAEVERIVQLNKVSKKDFSTLLLEVADQYVYLTRSFSDYKTYYLIFTCPPAGCHVYAAFPSAQVTAEQVLKVHNILVENGVSVPLFMSSCVDIPEEYLTL